MQEFNAKLSDFGLAKAGPTGDRTHVSTQVIGTHGYAAPEYVATGLSSTCPNHFLVPFELICCVAIYYEYRYLVYFVTFCTILYG